jgi:D-sedoheptulose 7-phosphate isomerase
MTTDAAVSSEAVHDYFATLERAFNTVEVTDGSGALVDQQRGIAKAADAIRQASSTGNTVFVVGNGGSSGIASQVTYTFTHFKGVVALGLNDPSALTGIAADHGYDQVFARQLAVYGRRGDFLIAISSSGRSANILNAVAVARRNGLGILTLSGFKPENPLRQSGDLNLYVGSQEYGFVEVAHLALCHAVLDTPAAGS